ncbi:MAG: DegV family protein [Actinomycetota bacterium]|nr:MAG: EDD domain-containing protein DegV [Actinomycetota bacterium]MDO8950170.1 DegV family protein [Actinomycetota bacterium]MDP3630491.1 DegV family protein [Actinomycetota bacterium]
MKEVSIVTDSTTDIPNDLAKAYDIAIVPLVVNFGDESFLDGELSQEQFFERMNASAKLPTTSQPAVGVFVEMYQKQLETARTVVSIHVSSALSGTIESAREAARQFGERVHVFDTLNLSMGEGMQVIEAARTAATGAGVQEVLRALDDARRKVKMIVGLDKVDNLAKGGRIGKVAALLGGMLSLRVLFTVADVGSFEPVARVRGAKAAMDETLSWVEQQMGSCRRARFAIMHALSPDKATWLEERLRERYTIEELNIVKVGPVIATHTGTGWGVALLPLD